MDQESCRSDKQYLMGRFEEAVMLATLACGVEATAEAVRGQIGRRLGERPITTIITTLDRLADKGFLESRREEQAAKRRGGKKRLLYRATTSGVDNVSRSLSLIADLAEKAGLTRTGEVAA